MFYCLYWIYVGVFIFLVMYNYCGIVLMCVCRVLTKITYLLPYLLKSPIQRPVHVLMLLIHVVRDLPLAREPDIVLLFSALSLSRSYLRVCTRRASMWELPPPYCSQNLFLSTLVFSYVCCLFCRRCFSRMYDSPVVSNALFLAFLFSPTIQFLRLCCSWLNENIFPNLIFVPGEIWPAFPQLLQWCRDRLTLT